MTTIREVQLRLENEDYQRIVKFLMEGGGIGEEIELRATDYQNRFNLGTFKAKITEFILAPTLTN